MRSAECGMRNSRAGIGSTGRIPGPTSALQFRIPHSAFRIGLVDWFNAVDATYRSDLRELNELNFARFDAKLEQRIAELRAELQTEMRAGFAQADARMLAGFARVDQRVAEFEARLTKRMLNFWIAQAATTVALVLGVVKLVKG